MERGHGDLADGRPLQTDLVEGICPEWQKHLHRTQEN